MGEKIMLKQMKWSNILMSLAYIVIGVLLILYPDISASVISYIIGIGLCVFGAVHLIGYFLSDVKDSLYNNSFTLGLMTVVFGIAVIAKKDLIIDMIPIILGLIIITSGLMKVQRSVVASRIHYSASIYYAILGMISIAFGIVIMFFLSGQAATNILFIVIGCGLVYSGASDLFIQFFLTKKFNEFIRMFENAIKKTEDNIIDTEISESTQSIHEQADAEVVEPKDIPIK